MKITVREHARFSADRMVKVGLATTPRVQLDLYCLEPGQEQTAHRHGDQDKLYLVLEGRARVVVEDGEEVLGAGEAAVARAGQLHGLANLGPGRLLVAVVVSPPPPHA
ncbi:MAG TPA: cupin domain-containing protein [Candidatus Binatia bacterium]|nr:cupin domain-containing protein [Candidatus Binatia bacterium]